MTETTVVHLLRHGQVDNPRRVLYGRLPGFHLSDEGLLMAKATARHLATRDITALFSSPLERARETAEPLSEQFGLPIVIDDRLIEAGNHFEGFTFGVGDGSLRRPKHWLMLRNPFRPSWGEPYSEIAARMLAAMATARDAARGHEAVCVSHQLPIWVARRAVEGVRLWHNPGRRQCGLASLTSFTYEGDKVVSVAYCEPAGPPGAAGPGAPATSQPDIPGA
ncbi:MAG TPA: histidine phosphatase family protein [Streptosporangiaceae bacterium]|nr:histidine phosphatase family protein [Streptosporangiaceae bacterium]